MQIVDLTIEHAAAAEQLAKDNYLEEVSAVSSLPADLSCPQAGYFAQNGMGVAAVENGKLLGFFSCFEPWEHAFNSAAKGTFSPLPAHGAIKENREYIYKRLYQAAAEKWVGMGIMYHAAAFYAHDKAALDALFSYGFGMRCEDAVREVKPLNIKVCDNITCREIDDPTLVRGMRKSLSDHLGMSPCFMKSTQDEYEAWLARAESRDTRLFAAFDGTAPIAFVELGDDGENFITEVPYMKNICGAYCLPQYRGKNVYSTLIGYLLSVLMHEDVKLLGVDYESINPTAAGFWHKHFTPYTKSVVRRIDECALN